MMTQTDSPFLSSLNSLYEKTPDADKTRFQVKLMLAFVIDSDAPRGVKLDMIFAAVGLAYIDAQLNCIDNLLCCQKETKVSFDKIISSTGSFLLKKELKSRKHILNLFELFVSPPKTEEKK